MKKSPLALNKLLNSNIKSDSVQTFACERSEVLIKSVKPAVKKNCHQSFGNVHDPVIVRGGVAQKQMLVSHLSHLHFDTKAVIVWHLHRTAQASHIKAAAPNDS